MYRTCIVVADASRARLFTHERSADADGLHEGISEVRDLVNPARRLRPAQLFSDSRPGSSRSGDLQYTFDDHRDANIDERDAGFARAIVDTISDQLRSSPVQRLILCASPRMLGELRKAGRELRRDSLTIHEVPRDLVKLSPHELGERLASYGLLPQRSASTEA